MKAQTRTKLQQLVLRVDSSLMSVEEELLPAMKQYSKMSENAPTFAETKENYYNLWKTQKALKKIRKMLLDVVNQ